MSEFVVSTKSPLKAAANKTSGACSHKNCDCKCAKKRAKTKKAAKKSTEKSKKKMRQRYPSKRWIREQGQRPPRCLLTSIQAFRGVLPKRTMKSFRKNYAESVNSILGKHFDEKDYMPAKRKRVKNWAFTQQWVDEKSKAKKFFTEKVKRGPRVRLDQLSRYKYLQIPRYPRKKFVAAKANIFNMPIWKVAQAALHYECTERTKRLSGALERFRRNKFQYDYGAPSSKKKVIRMKKCPPRIRRLAVPKMEPPEPMRNETERGVSINAMKYKVTQHTLALAKPKPATFQLTNVDEDEEIVIEDRELTEHGVCVSALKYNISERMKDMAMPRQPPPPSIDFPPDERPRTEFNVVINAIKYKPTKRIKALYAQ